MISVAMLAGGGAAGYYTRARGCQHELLDELTDPARVARGLERHLDGDEVGYYVNGRDAPGEWVGGGARALGLTGRLETSEGRVLQELLEGRHDGQVLVPSVWRRDDTGARTDVRRAGFDVTFSAPKSVSTLMALAPPGVAAEVVAAHRLAAAEALTLLESLSARAARGHQGQGRRAPRIGTEGFVAAAFTHTTSRALDPQLHTHVVIANLACGEDGRWSALDSRTLHREATTASYLYQHRLRAELTHRLGLAWNDVVRGVAEVDGVPLAVRREFSTRRRQIEHALEHGDQRTALHARKRARHLAAQAACLLTRPAKRHQPAAALREQWAARAHAAGFSRDEAQQLLTRAAGRPAVTRLDLPAVLERVLAPEGVTREESTFGQGVLLRELISQLPPGAPVPTRELLRLTAGLVGTDEVVPVITADGRAYTTRDLLQTEAATLALATRRGPALAKLGRAPVAAAVARADGLRPAQQRVAFALLTSGRPVDVVSGPAGCGKTAGLALAAQAWRETELEVRGTAVAALTAQALEQASGAAAVSLARVLARPEVHVPVGGVLLVDEAGMIGTRQLHQLLTAAADRQCKVVLVGDPSQLPELEAGGMFARLTAEPTALTLDGHHRQQHRWERDALHLLRGGDVAAALDAYRRHERLHPSHDPEHLRAGAVAAYLDSRAEQRDPWQTVLLASNRDDVRLLNDTVREKLLATGELGRRTIEIDSNDGPREFRTGDQVLVTRNDHRRGLLNGTTATVTALHPNGLTLTTASGRDARVDRDWLVDGRLDHGYAMTLHKAQGRTVHTAILVGSEALTTQAGYVGLSRGTHANHLFLASRDLHDLTTDCSSAVQHRPASRSLPGPAPLTRDARRRLAAEAVDRSLPPLGPPQLAEHTHPSRGRLR